MRFYFCLFILFIFGSCTTGNKEVSNTDFDSLVALKFMNEYVALCNKRIDPKPWVGSNKLLSDAFKKEYKELFEIAYAEDPEMGLDFDPIFDAQDYPDKGFEISSLNSKTRTVIIQGIDSPDFKVTLKVKKINNEWLVDGAGVIGVPKNQRMKR
ncbi:hypothetical protein [Fluviicola taffensis]|uniref:DUF3828 domain-containing protein n=1 Tax=Fluviicola taffensis (strain DSM 16823 / NCIMB 13979 / RW262) TaxID=755732 RepID=F2IGA5_FLUTR|nr:hypothetical protein [Fluviicola taffensis]AEA45771.1 hypothetical protein Fluta_3804 [Fluviicola taffensis DSM 16823]